MPFALLDSPPLGVSLLKASLAGRGIDCDIHYLNILMADRIGLPLYQEITWAAKRLSLGEWFFAQELFGHPWAEGHPLLERMATRKGIPDEPGEGLFPPDQISALWEAREGAGVFLEECLSAVPWNQYKIIGFSLSHQQNIASLALAKRIKAAWPEVVIILGGANCAGQIGLELHRQFPFVDFVCRGESDVLFPALVENLLAGEELPNLPGLVIRDRDGESVPVGDAGKPVSDLDSLPYPNFDDYFEGLERSSLDMGGQVRLTFESSRGCWYGDKSHCTFCGQNVHETVFRAKSPGRVLDELTYLTRRYGIHRLGSTDLILDMGYLRDLLPEIIERNPGWHISYSVKSNLGKNQLRLMRQAGLNSIGPGIENLSTSVLELMRKGCTALGNVSILKWAAEFGIYVYWVFLWGLPGEDPGEYRRMAVLVPALLHLPPPGNTTLPRLVRFSPYFKDPHRWGFVNVRAASWYSLIYPFSEEVLGRLALNFDYEYADGRDPSVYLAPLREMIQYWREHYCPGALTCLSSGPDLIIFDRRPGAEQSRVELKGVEKAIYEYCDEAHSVQDIHTHLLESGYRLEEGALRDRLEKWVKDLLMLSEGDCYLGLAVSSDSLAGELSQDDVIRQALSGTIAGLCESIRKQSLEAEAPPTGFF